MSQWVQLTLLSLALLFTHIPTPCLCLVPHLDMPLLIPFSLTSCDSLHFNSRGQSFLLVKSFLKFFYFIFTSKKATQFSIAQCNLSGLEPKPYVCFRHYINTQNTHDIRHLKKVNWFLWRHHYTTTLLETSTVINWLTVLIFCDQNQNTLQGSEVQAVLVLHYYFFLTHSWTV